MKAKHCIGGLTVGALIGIGIGYWIATDPKRRRKIGRFITDVENKACDIKDSIVDKYQDIKETLQESCGCGLTEEEMDEIDDILAVEAIVEAEVRAEMEAVQAELDAELEADKEKKNKKAK